MRKSIQPKLQFVVYGDRQEGEPVWHVCADYLEALSKLNEFRSGSGYRRQFWIGTVRSYKGNPKAERRGAK